MKKLYFGGPILTMDRDCPNAEAVLTENGKILAVGDFLFQQKCENRISELMSGGTTVLIVSHTIEQIERLCNRVIWLEHGVTKMIGETKTVCDLYKLIER